MEKRIISFEGIANCRDLGGLSNREGRTVRSGLLLRSANLAGAGAEDTGRLGEQYRLRRIVDLRTSQERREQPDVPVPGAEHLPVPIFDERVAGISHEKEQKESPRIPVMEELYRMIVIDCAANLGRAVRAVMETDFSRGSVLWHCTEGKDRCGLVSAMVLTALGVDRETILADYLMTNLVNEAKAERYYRGVLASGRGEEEALAVRNAFLAKASYLDAAFSAIEEKFGSAEAYLTGGLAVPASTLEAFRAAILE